MFVEFMKSIKIKTGFVLLGCSHDLFLYDRSILEAMINHFFVCFVLAHQTEFPSETHPESPWRDWLT